jgi:two-component system OmpR family response regulator
MTTGSPFASVATRPDADRETLRGQNGRAIRVLVVDDEQTLAELLALALRYEGWDVRTAADGVSAVTAVRDFEPDLAVLDVMLPDLDGLEVLRRIRTRTERLPVLFLTARDAAEDKVSGLTLGGDDYVTKPFSLDEVLARIRASTSSRLNGLVT